MFFCTFDSGPSKVLSLCLPVHSTVSMHRKRKFYHIFSTAPFKISTVIKVQANDSFSKFASCMIVSCSEPYESRWNIKLHLVRYTVAQSISKAASGGLRGRSFSGSNHITPVGKLADLLTFKWVVHLDKRDMQCSQAPVIPKDTALTLMA